MHIMVCGRFSLYRRNRSIGTGFSYRSNSQNRIPFVGYRQNQFRRQFICVYKEDLWEFTRYCSKGCITYKHFIPVNYNGNSCWLPAKAVIQKDCCYSGAYKIYKKQTRKKQPERESWKDT